MNLLIHNGRLIDPSQALDQVTSLYLRDGKIAALGADCPAASEDIPAFDARGLCIIPGLVDLSVHLTEPGFDQKGTVASETQAAAAGGITHLCCTPDTQPIIDTPSVATLIQDLARETGRCRVHPIGAMTQQLRGQRLSEMHALKQAGCIAVTNLRYPLDDTRVLQRCLDYAATLDMPVIFTPEDRALAADGCVHQGLVATRLGLPGIPASAELVALSTALILVEQTGVKAHFSQLSSARAIDLIENAQSKGLPITADTSIYHLLETEAATADFNSLFHIRPPLRTLADRDALREALKEGVLNAICSAHQPHEQAAKMAPFEATEPGISGVQTLLPLALRLQQESGMELMDLIQRLTLGPAQCLGLKAGSLAVGEMADLCLFDPAASWQPEKHWLSKGLNSPYRQQSLKGKVRLTLIEGRPAYSD